MAPTCPLCGTSLPPEAELRKSEFRPFCSVRCKQLDLLNWLEGRYTLPRELTPEEFGELPEAEQEKLLGTLIAKNS